MKTFFFSKENIRAYFKGKLISGAGDFAGGVPSFGPCGTEASCGPCPVGRFAGAIGLCEAGWTACTGCGFCTGAEAVIPCGAGAGAETGEGEPGTFVEGFG